MSELSERLDTLVDRLDSLYHKRIYSHGAYRFGERELMGDKEFMTYLKVHDKHYRLPFFTTPYQFFKDFTWHPDDQESPIANIMKEITWHPDDQESPIANIMKEICHRAKSYINVYEGVPVKAKTPFGGYDVFSLKDMRSVPDEFDTSVFKGVSFKDIKIYAKLPWEMITTLDKYERIGIVLTDKIINSLMKSELVLRNKYISFEDFSDDMEKYDRNLKDDWVYHKIFQDKVNMINDGTYRFRFADAYFRYKNAMFKLFIMLDEFVSYNYRLDCSFIINGGFI